jgi:hypothetical protein
MFGRVGSQQSFCQGTALLITAQLLFCIRARLLVVPKGLEKRWALAPATSKLRQTKIGKIAATPEVLVNKRQQGLKPNSYRTFFGTT